MISYNLCMSSSQPPPSSVVSSDDVDKYKYIELVQILFDRVCVKSGLFMHGPWLNTYFEQFLRQPRGDIVLKIFKGKNLILEANAPKKMKVGKKLKRYLAIVVVTN